MKPEWREAGLEFHQDAYRFGIPVPDE